MNAATPSSQMSGHPSPAERPVGGSNIFFLQDRFTLTFGSLAALLLMLWLTGTMNIPAVPDRAGSILQQPHSILVMLVIWVAILAAGALASVIATRNHYDGGLFCACVALAGISSKFGPMRYALFAASGPSVYLSFCFELILLSVPLAAIWVIVRFLSKSGMLASELLLEDVTAEEPIDQKLLATVGQALSTMIIMLLICQTDAKKQTLASIAVASYFGSIIAYQFVSTRPSAWFFAGPLLVGLVGYAGQYFNAADWAIGEARGFFAPLARPMPLDYASLGVAGAILGYWTARSSHRIRLVLDQSDQ